MKKLFTLFAAALATLTMLAATPAGAGTYQVDGNKPGNSNRFIKLGNGVYIHRQNNSSWTDGLGMKLKSDNTNGVAVYVENSTKISALVKKKENKNASTVTFKVYPITEGAEFFAALEAGTDNSTEVAVTYGSTPVLTFETSFEALTEQIAEEKSTDEENINAGYYYIIGADDGAGICFLYSVTLAAGCEAPATPLSLSASKTSDIIVGDVITFSTEGGNGAAVKFFDGDTEISSPWTATKGSHSITAVQEDNAGVCGATTEALVLNVITHDPVTAATVSAPKTDIIIGEEVVLTCAAENADTFQWFKGENAIAGATEASYSFSSDAAGDFTFYCNASNAYTATPVKSNVLTIRVTTLCGELIKATTQQVVSGVIGGTVSTNLSKGDSKKLDKKKYFGVTLAAGAFAEDDIFVMNITTPAGATMGTMKLYADNAGSELLFESDEIGAEGENRWDLPASVAGKTSLYIYRGDGNDWNPTFTYISVERPCNGGEPSLKVSDASITLRATAQEPTVSKVVKFTGKNLPAGTYNFAINPAAAGLSVSPTSVTVPDNGKLNQEVTVTFAATADAGMAMAELSLAVDTLSQKVLIAYSASLSKEYGESIDFEQFVLDNGMSGNFAAALEAKHYIFSANGMSLDSLDNAKDDNNEPYLGLKIKAANAYVGCWLKQNDTIQIKFGKVSADVKFTAGTNELTKTPADLAEDFEFIAENAAVYVKFETTTADAVVVKHINILRAEEPIEGFEDVIDAARTATKIIRNGQLLIIRDGKVYTVQGVEVR